MPGRGAECETVLDGCWLDAGEAQRLGDLLQQGLGRLEDHVVHRIGIIVAHLNGAAGKAVMELAEKDGLPHVIDFLLGIPVGVVLEGSDGG